MADWSDPRRSRPGFGGGVRPATVGPRGRGMVGSESLLQLSQGNVRGAVREPPRSRPAEGGGTVAAGMGGRRATSSAGGGGLLGAGGSSMLRRRLSPTMVLVMSLCFIGFVTALYIFGSGKLYRSRTAAASA